MKALAYLTVGFMAVVVLSIVAAVVAGVALVWGADEMLWGRVLGTAVIIGVVSFIFGVVCFAIVDEDGL